MPASRSLHARPRHAAKWQLTSPHALFVHGAPLNVTARKKDLLRRAIELGETLAPEDLALSNMNWGDIKFDKVASAPYYAAARADKIRAVAAAEEAAFLAAQVGRQQE